MFRRVKKKKNVGLRQYGTYEYDFTVSVMNVTTSKEHVQEFDKINLHANKLITKNNEKRKNYNLKQI